MRLLSKAHRGTNEMTHVYYEPQFKPFIRVVPFGAPLEPDCAHKGAFLAPNGDLLTLLNASDANLVFSMLYQKSFDAWKEGTPKVASDLTAFRYRYPSGYTYLRVGFFYRVFCLSKPYTANQSVVAATLMDKPLSKKVRYRIGYSPASIKSMSEADAKLAVRASLPQVVTHKEQTDGQPKTDAKTLIAITTMVTGLTVDDLVNLSTATESDYPEQLRKTIVKVSDQVRVPTPDVKTQ